MKKNKTKTVKTPAAKTAQDVLPYLGISEDGIAQNDNQRYSVSMLSDDINFEKVDEEEQERVFIEYEKLLNTPGEKAIIQVTAFNQPMSEDYVSDKFMIPHKNDGFDHLRDERNEMIKSRLKDSYNTRKLKMFTVSIPADSADEAKRELASITEGIKESLHIMDTKAKSEILNAFDRINYLYKMINPGKDDDFMPRENFNLAEISKQGITTKDLICPGSFDFNPSHPNSFIINGETYAQTVFLDNLPTQMAPKIFGEFTDLPGTQIVSCTYYTVPNPMKVVKTASTNIKREVAQAQKAAIRSGYSEELISDQKKDAKKAADTLRDDVINRNQKIFLTTLTITVFEKSIEALEKKISQLDSLAKRNLCKIKELPYQQMDAFRTCLPFARKDIKIDRLLTSESGSVFIPFRSYDIKEEDGIYYGLNPITKEIIYVNRKHGLNPNAVVLGMPGAGKSFLSKKEMEEILLSSSGNDDIFIIDPEGEYTEMAMLQNGHIIEISPSSTNFINPFDMDINYDENPIATKIDYIKGILEQMTGGALPKAQASIADRCARMLYEVYLNKIREANAVKEAELGRSLNKNEEITCLPSESPTLVDFYNLLKAQNEPEARNLALTIEQYCTGSANLFAHKSNVSIPEGGTRLIVYNTKKIGTTMKDLGINICLNDVWNKVFENFKKGRTTWFYIDEFYLLLQSPSSAKFLQMIYKRARKWNGIPTGMTQNVEDLLRNPEARTILSTSNYVFMLSQAPLDRQQLAAMLHISPAEEEYITNAKQGCGLLSINEKLIPFEDNFPKDTELYKVMTTKPEERKI